MGDHPVGSRWARIPVPVGLVAGLLVAFVAGGSPGPGGEAAVPGHLAVGMPAPDFVAPGLSGGTVALAHYAGHPTVVTFFTTLCGECLGDLGVLEPVYRRYQAQGLVIVGIGVGDTAEDLRQAARQYRVSFPLGLDERGDRVAVSYGLTMVPTTVFVDRDGVVRAVVRGALRGAALERHLAEILPEGLQ
jgi:cytochrome c biogenesis protein CcmG/thiol:disulfide interchange protein DsbE